MGTGTSGGLRHIMVSVPKNKQRLLGLKVPDGKDRIQVSIEGEPGLALKVFASGERRWSFRHKVRLGDDFKQQSHQLGSFPTVSIADACREASNLREAIRKGTLASTKGSDTIQSLSDEWMARHCAPLLASDTLVSYRMTLDTYILPIIGNIKVGALKKSQILTITDKLIAAGKGHAANRVVRVISAMHTWLNERLDEPIANPTTGIRMSSVSTGTGDGKRPLKPDEIRKFWHGIEAINVGPQIVLCLRLLLLTGQRTTAVAGARVDEFNLDAVQPIWTIPPRTGAKAKLPHVIPLPPMAATMWRDAILEHAGDGFVFPAARKADTPHLNRHTVNNACAKYRTRFKTDAPAPHGLRKTVRTMMASLQVPDGHANKVLNHSEGRAGTIQSRYDRHHYVPEKLNALQLWEDELTRLVN